MTQCETKELELCPFCGGKAEIREGEVYLRRVYTVRCLQCYARTKMVFVNSPNLNAKCKGVDESTRYTDERAQSLAAEAWNRRQEMSEMTHKPTVSEFKRMAVQLGYEKVVHGQLEDQYGKKYSNHRFVCSECGKEALLRMRNSDLGNPEYTYALSDVCPHCGAKMDGEAENATL